MVLHIIYILVSKLFLETWGGWSLDAFQHWGTYMKLAIPAMLMFCIEWWSFEIGTFLTGGCTITISILFLTLRYYIPRAFTDDTEVIEISANLLPILALFILFDGTCGVAQGAIRGSGRQLPGAIAMFIGYYIIALPIGIPLMFLTDMRATGLWWGLTLGLMIVSTTVVLIVCFTDWDKAAKLALERAGVMTDDDTISNHTKTPDTSKASETTALLSNKERSFEQSGNSIRSNRLNRQFSTSYNVENAPIDLEKLEHTGELTNAELLCRRGIAVLICLFIVGIGVLIRLVVKYPEELTMLCVPWDGTGPLPNTTMPICNVTMETTTIFSNITTILT
ncbi:unnamed protein product [Owenia fusiformis]|uniref:Uncharacterized protein n=1 Tax=Owenia fusiformis TaxID=6347 RepID=A0A8S4N7P2_OWEFU|nr:unnamed protein product [Owenia fusiformis]